MYKRIRDLREDLDLNQTQVAKMLKMSQTGYSKYETGENDVPTAVLITLANFYNVSIDYLLGQTDVKERNKKWVWTFTLIYFFTFCLFEGKT